jgi:hydroxypyruvate reductase
MIMPTQKTAESEPAGSALVTEMRATALDIFMHTLAESSIARMFNKSVSYERGVLRVGDESFDINSFARIFVVAIGKASHTMVQALGERFGAGVGVSGLACGPLLPDAQVFGYRYYKGGHPLPNQDSVKAAEAMLRAVEPLTGRDLVIFMLSGGGSALVEKPIATSISLEDLVATYRALVHSGAPIAEINTVRKHLSAIKGGRLALAASPAHQLSIMISDVPENALDSLASGPTMPDTSTVEQCYALVDKYKLLPQFPASVRQLFEGRAILETPKPADAVFSRSRWCTLASNAVAEKVAVEKAAMSGFAIEVDNSCDDWDYVPAADYLLKRLRELRKGVSRVCLISGGEITVKVEGKGGVGGRNQHFALYCAQKIAGENITVLSAGTDGIDGDSDAAGAVVDGTTMARIQQQGLSAEQALKTFNSTPLFQSLGDVIMTGPTGNNLRDLRVLLAY